MPKIARGHKKKKRERERKRKTDTVDNCYITITERKRVIERGR